MERAELSIKFDTDITKINEGELYLVYQARKITGLPKLSYPGKIHTYPSRAHVSFFGCRL